MKAALLIEDRDTGYLFLDPKDADPDAVPVDVDVDGGVSLAGDERDQVWLQNDDGTKIHVVSSVGYDHAAEFDLRLGHPIPAPIVVRDKAEYERLLAE